MLVWFVQKVDLCLYRVAEI